MTAQHTPGPWVAYVQSFPHEILICTTGPFSNYDSPVVEQIAWTAKNTWQTGTERHGAQKERDYANARLIAAAPELLDVVKTLRDYIADTASGALHFSDSGEGVKAMAAEDLARVDAAIAKATGAA